MSGTIMNKIWGAFGMDAEENEEKNYEEVNEEVEEEENKENKLWGRRNNNKVVSLPQTQQIKWLYHNQQHLNKQKIYVIY